MTWALGTTLVAAIAECRRLRIRHVLVLDGRPTLQFWRKGTPARFDVREDDDLDVTLAGIRRTAIDRARSTQIERREAKAKCDRRQCEPGCSICGVP